MSNEYKDIPSSKAAFRGKMLVAWFAEATPPVVWRWVASDVSSGFGLRQNDGKVDLLRYDTGATPAVIASFPSIEAGEQALSRLSSALLRYKSPWKEAAKWLTGFGAVTVLLIGLMMLYENVQKNLTIAGINRLEAAQAQHTGHSAANVPTGQLQQAFMKKQQENAAAAGKPSGTAPTGTAVDVDSVYH